MQRCRLIDFKLVQAGLISQQVQLPLQQELTQFNFASGPWQQLWLEPLQALFEVLSSTLHILTLIEQMRHHLLAQNLQ